MRVADQAHRPVAPVNATLVIDDVPYSSANGEPLLLDILRPDPVPSQRMPAIIEVHGGGWYEGEKDVERNRLLAEHGFFTVSVNYRLSGQAPFPAQIHDVKAAVRWMRAHADGYHVDPDRIGVWDGSAGGHLVALLGTSGDVPALEGEGGWGDYSSRVQAVVDECGATDMHDPAFLERRKPGGALDQLFGGPIEERSDLVQLANPIRYIRADVPPFLIVHGTDDEIVPVSQSEWLTEALEKVGADVTYVPVPGGKHAFAEHWDTSMEHLRLQWFLAHL